MSSLRLNDCAIIEARQIRQIDNQTINNHKANETQLLSQIMHAIIPAALRKHKLYGELKRDCKLFSNFTKRAFLLVIVKNYINFIFLSLDGD